MASGPLPCKHVLSSARGRSIDPVPFPLALSFNPQPDMALMNNEQMARLTDEAADIRNRTLGEAQEAVRGAKPAAQTVVAGVQDLAARTRDAAVDMRDQTRAAIADGAEQARSRVGRAPFTTVTIAALAGALLGALLGRRR
jgi:ElaB/YqjD/DUF883 family membrane-anchored ribosome-binding protein